MTINAFLFLGLLIIVWLCGYGVGRIDEKGKNRRKKELENIVAGVKARNELLEKGRELIEYLHKDPRDRMHKQMMEQGSSKNEGAFEFLKHEPNLYDKNDDELLIIKPKSGMVCVKCGAGSTCFACRDNDRYLQKALK